MAAAKTKVCNISIQWECDQCGWDILIFNLPRPMMKANSCLISLAHPPHKQISAGPLSMPQVSGCQHSPETDMPAPLPQPVTQAMRAGPHGTFARQIYYCARLNLYGVQDKP